MKNIIIYSLPRSGSTHLHNMLSCYMNSYYRFKFSSLDEFFNKTKLIGYYDKHYDTYRNTHYSLIKNQIVTTINNGIKPLNVIDVFEYQHMLWDNYINVDNNSYFLIKILSTQIENIKYNISELTNNSYNIILLRDIFDNLLSMLIAMHINKWIYFNNESIILEYNSIIADPATIVEYLDDCVFFLKSLNDINDKIILSYDDINSSTTFDNILTYTNLKNIDHSEYLRILNSQYLQPTPYQMNKLDYFKNAGEIIKIYHTYDFDSLMKFNH